MLIKTAFEPGEEIPDIYTCLGQNISLPLELDDVSEEAESLVLIFEDIDADPISWTHWLVFNIPASTIKVEADQIPSGGTEGLANNHSFGYEGPCPKYFEGIHHYSLSIYALSTWLNLPAATEKAEVLRAMNGHILEKAELIGICTKKQGKE